MPEIELPDDHGALSRLRLSEPAAFECAGPGVALPRRALAAAHVVADPLADISPFEECRIDMEATLRYREYLWDLGLGVAEAMDTAQRGMGLPWQTTQDLITETLSHAAGRKDAMVYCGVGTDDLDDPAPGLDDIIRAYSGQLAFVQKYGGRAIIMASRSLAAIATGPEDYAYVYGHVLEQAEQPVILHWLGEMFDSALAGYWGSANTNRAMQSCLDILARNAAKIEGIKISLLSRDWEVEMRRRLPSEIQMYTGDDFNYAELIAGDEKGYSDALLGIFDAIAPAASAALRALGAGDERAFFDILEPTVPLSRHIFKAPTRFYKTGVVFLAYLNGFQDHFTMIGGQESTRSLVHLAELFRLADKARVLNNPDRAAQRMRRLLAVNGIF